MNRDRWLLLISVLLFSAAAVYSLRPAWLGMLAAKKPLTVAVGPSTAPPAPPQGMPAANLPPVSVRSETVNELTPWGRNPFLTGEEEAAQGKNRGGDGLQVKAVIVGQPRSVATIDGRTVTVGERLGEETVSEIRPDGVLLERDGHKRLLKVSEPTISVVVKEGKK